MSHVVGVGSVSMTGHVAGKRLGVKKYEGQEVKSGNIILKQRGSLYHPGRNTYLSKDYSIHAKTDGVVKFRRMSGFKRGQYYVDVVESIS
jgi:large subunit ribosomal protein L27